MCSQEFFLACPLRSPHKPPALRRLFFNLFSFLPQLPRTKDMGANNQFSLVLGIDRESQAEPFHWVTGKSPCQTYQVKKESYEVYMLGGEMFAEMTRFFPSAMTIIDTF